MGTYCKFENVCEDFIFVKLRICNMRSFMKIKTSQNGQVTLSFTYVGKSCPSHEFLTRKMSLLTIFAEFKFL